MESSWRSVNLTKRDLAVNGRVRTSTDNPSGIWTLVQNYIVGFQDIRTRAGSSPGSESIVGAT
jgi:hypothetical protein